MNARRILTAPLLALTLLGTAAATATAAPAHNPWPNSGQGPAASSVPFGAPFSADPFYEDFFSRAKAHQDRAIPSAPSAPAAAPHCPPPATGNGSSGDSDALLDSDITSSTSIL
ncbi:hypothetical protein [Streptomyces sp. NPDC059009]|uniref:hypothetical protein n=1 Tax=Streptomyces sp. NPDC059009 TaxID=3346694 RepID=UPI0036999AE9